MTNHRKLTRELTSRGHVLRTRERLQGATFRL